MYVCTWHFGPTTTRRCLPRVVLPIYRCSFWDWCCQHVAAVVVIAIAHLKRYEYSYILLNWIFLGYDFLITCSHSTAAPGPCGNIGVVAKRGNLAAIASQLTAAKQLLRAMMTACLWLVRRAVSLWLLQLPLDVAIHVAVAVAVVVRSMTNV